MNFELGLLCRGATPWPNIHDHTARRARPRRGDWHRLDPMPRASLHSGASSRSTVCWLVILAGLIFAAGSINRGQSDATIAPALSTIR